MQQNMNMNSSGRGRLLGLGGWIVLVCGGALGVGAMDSVAGVGFAESVSVVEMEGPAKSKPKAAPSKKTPRKKATPSRSKPATKPARKPAARKPAAKRAKKPASRPAARPASRPAARPNARPSAKPAARPSRGPTTRPASKPATRPSSKKKATPSSKPSTQPTRQPGSKPKARPGVTPSTKPKSTRPSIQPSARPGARPSTKPSTKPSTRPNVRPSDRPNQTPTVQPKPKAEPRPRPGVQMDVNPDALTTHGVKRGVQKKEAVGKRITPVVKGGETPIGFKIDLAKQKFLNQTRGGGGGTMKGVGGKMSSLDDGDASGGGHHDDGHNGHGGDHHHDDHGGHGDHGDHGGVHIDINFYIHNSCPSGWWYLYGDYNGDGYRDYVCTNGSRSVYWYGWSGYYWGASPWYGWYGNGYGARYGYTWWWSSVPDRYRGGLYGSNGDLSTDPGYSSMPADQQAMPDAIPLSAVEVARLEMSIGEPGVAIDAYKAHLSEYPNDWRAVRELGLAMFRLGDRGDGIAMMSYAYSMDPDLAYDAVPASLFEDSSRLLRDAVIDAVGWGHRNPSASVWLTVAVLMQAEGRDGPGLRMIERARGYGLDSAVDLAMESALSHR